MSHWLGTLPSMKEQTFGSCAGQGEAFNITFSRESYSRESYSKQSLPRLQVTFGVDNHYTVQVTFGIGDHYMVQVTFGVGNFLWLKGKPQLGNT